MEITKEKQIFISYSHQDKKIADEIEDSFNCYGLDLTRDISVVKYKDSFKDFMKLIRKADFVIMIISDSFLTSHNCMYEVIEFIKDDNFKDRILPIAYNANIYLESEKIKYIKYWNNKYMEIENEIKTLPSEQLISISHNQKVFREISTNVGDFIEFIRDLNHKSYNELLENNFSDLFDILSIRKKSPSEKVVNDYINSVIKYKIDKLSLRHSDLKTIPEKIFELLNLKVLDIGYNKIQEIPRDISILSELVFIDISNNEIKELPIEIIELPNLLELKIDDNPLEKPPLPVAKRGIKSIINYFESLKVTSVVKLFEANVILIGDGGVGKTSLYKKILNNNYAAELSSTIGIVQNKWLFSIDKTDSFKVNFVDFGGQAIYHSVHQFLFTNRSLYIYVFDVRRDRIIEDIYYWLSLVSILSKESKVIIVQNKMDINPTGISLDLLTNRFPEVIEIVQVSVKTGENIEYLKELIQRELLKLPHIGATIPTKWMSVKKEIENLNDSYISLEQYEEICLSYGIDIESSLLLSQYLHDLGTFLHFQDNSILKGILIIKPEWAFQAIYKITDNRKVIEDGGEFNYELLEKVWNEYSKVMYSAILELLFKFDICFQISGTNRFIVPQLLPVEEPDIQWDFTNNIILQYNYEYLPHFIISRLIVRTFDLQKGNIRWRFGAILKLNETTAYVRLDNLKKTISVCVKGSDSKRLLSRIRQEIKTINLSYNNLQYQEFIPCICNSCKGDSSPAFYESSSIRNRLDKGRRQVECYNSFENVDIIDLLQNVSSFD